jgi:hypothetical protein
VELEKVFRCSIVWQGDWRKMDYTTNATVFQNQVILESAEP